MLFLDLLATLDAQELAAFDKHLKTAHAKERIALWVFAHFKQFHPRFEDPAPLELDFVVQKLKRQGVVAAQFDRKQLSNTCSELYGWLKDFLLLKKARDKSLESEYLWLTVLRERGMKAAEGRSEAALFERVWSAQKQDVWAFCWSMVAHYAACFDSDSRKVKDTNEAIEALSACSLALEQFYDACRCKVNCELQSWRSKLGAAAPAPTEAKGVGEEPLALLYGMAEALFSGGGMAEYEALEAAMGRYSNLVAENELYRIWNYLKNYDSHRLRMGDQAAWTRAHQLDRFALQHGLFQRKSPIQFLNVINAAASLGEYEWAASFIADYLAGVEEGMRHEATILGDAILLFSQEQYEEVFQQLKQFDDDRFKEPHFAIRLWALKLMSMYELGMDYERLHSYALNVDAFLRRSKSPWKDAAKAMLLFLRFYRKLFSLKPKPHQIMADIEAANPLVFRDWLLEKFGEYRPVR